MINIPTFFIVNPKYKEGRYNTILSLIRDNNIMNYSFITHTWACDITPEIRSIYAKSDIAMRYQGRNMDKNPLINGEISLFLNYIECLRRIRDNYDRGIFIIFESDIMLYDNFKENLERVIELSKSIDWDTINIGTGNGRDTPKSEPIKSGLHLYKEPINKFAEGIIWNYTGVCKFLKYFEETSEIDAPIDCKMDYYSEHLKKFNIYWAEPGLVWQRSARGIIKSHLAR
jgi:GR25 family glycosyltransferase involved in LPS biosynthesis